MRKAQGRLTVPALSAWNLGVGPALQYVEDPVASGRYAGVPVKKLERPEHGMVTHTLTPR